MILLRLRTIARYGSVLVPSLKSDLQRVSLSSICRPLLTVKHEWNDPMPMAMPMAMAMEPLSWRPPPPCQVGDNSEDLDTPALVVDMDVVDRNLRALSKQMQQYPNVSVRPHVKAHKCPQLAKLQVEHGAVGVCAQTLTEAEAMVYGGGCSNVLLSNQVSASSFARVVNWLEY
ncbi:hypothetical protein NP493_149g00004 [Ridgeia piscesae]|uniref:Alanine racemase N-terminal domain-containing protein n=1 Tax=Ridgeia piscesae TaxID=27915 RepID=A0AAD9P4M4_RIDPI|nr:hypothetical protein NP493_149g00004 [Ridgeia piscesae]